jgi:hypothetical protein
MVVPLFALDDAPAVLRQFRAFARTAPDEMGPQALFWSVPAVDDFPVELHGKPIVVVQVVYAGDPDEGQRLMQPVLAWAPPVLDLSGRMPYAVTQSAFDAFFPAGWRYYWKSLLLDELSDAAIDAIVEAAADRPSPQAIVNLLQLGGAISRVPPAATAFSGRGAGYMLSFDTTWVDAADTDRCVAWTRQTWSSMQRFGQGGLYLNFAGLGEEKEALVRAAYGANYDRLVALKTKYDPRNLFRMNQNISPLS